MFAFANGALREIVLIPRLGDRTGHIISTLLLSATILAMAWFIIPWVRPASIQDAWLAGILWVLLTLAFEFLAGHYLFHNSWEKLLADYNVARGRIWILVLVTTLLAPVLVTRLRAG